MRLKNLFITLISTSIFSHSLFASNIVKSPNDQRSYQGFTLENQMQVLLISDPQAQKAAVSLNVDVGSASNPIARPGLAHFLEHMLFLGTEKYPDADEYSNFINSHGGSQNAFTAVDNTNYFFDIKADSLEPGLDRFAQFFISPLFSEKYTQRERLAVHSEYQSKLKDDAQRNYTAFKQIINPAHPESRFAVGSLQTLADNEQSKIRDDLIQFYQQYYSANQMSLVVLGKEPLSVLKNLVTEKFAQVKNLHTAKPSTDIKKFSQDQLPVQLNVKTLKDYRHLTLTFPTRAAQQYYREKPLQYISSLLGYEGQGSLTSYLKKLGYINALSTSVSHDNNLESNLQVRMSLTQEGLAHQNDIIRYFFTFVKELKTSGIKPQLYKEMAQLSEQAFRFLPKQTATGYVVNLSQRLKDYPSEHWLNAGYLLEHFNAQRISEFIDYIKPSNVFINLQTPFVKTDKTAPYFDAQYAVVAIAKDRLTQWQTTQAVPELFVRPLNPYIADDLSVLSKSKDSNELKTTDKATPKAYQLAQGLTLWHLQDRQFLTPKANLFFTFIKDNKVLSTTQQLTLSLLVRLINDQFNELFYDAASAGIYINLYPHTRGISLRISGYNDKQGLIIEKLPKLADIQFDEERFALLKSNFLRSLNNKAQEKPYQQLIEELNSTITGSAKTELKVSILEKLTLKDVYSLADNIFSSGEVRVLAHGNLSASVAKQYSQNLVTQLGIANLKPSQSIKQVISLPENSPLSLVKQIENSDSAVVMYLQAANASNAQRASTALLSEMIATRYSNQLRTEQQLGYLVFASSMSLQKLAGVVFIVQSPSASPEEIQASNRQFLLDVKQYLATMSDEQLERFKRSIITRYETKEQSIYNRSSRFWQEINSAEPAFNDRLALIKETQQLTLDELSKQWDVLTNRKLSLLSYSSKIESPAQSAQQTLLELAQLKQQLQASDK